MYAKKVQTKRLTAHRTHKRTLRILYKDYECPFETLLTRSGSFCIQARNLQNLMTEIYSP